MKRQKFTAEFKAKVALDAIRNNLTIPELSQKYGVHPTQIQRWKSELVANAKEPFANRKVEIEKNNEQRLAELERKIGQLTIENDYLKKNLEGYHKKNEFKW